MAALEFLNMTANTTVYRYRGDWGPRATEFLQHDRRHRGWSIAEQPPPIIGTWLYQIMLHGTPITHCSLCVRAEAAEAFWQYVKALPYIVLEPPARPAYVPWLAVHLLPGAFKLTRQKSPRMYELADLEAAVAWDSIDST